jgi:crossover junction endodeoxyribonuclease RuvC
MIALGIDPGTAICGYGVVEEKNSHLEPLFYGAVITTKDMAPEMRLKKIYEDLTDIIKHFHPDVMSVEKLFFNRNVTTAIPVGQARGIVLLTAAMQNLPILEFTPMQIKMSVVGYGKADKKQVTFMVQRLLNIKEAIKPDDVSDALAMAICGLHVATSPRWQQLQKSTGLK